MLIKMTKEKNCYIKTWLTQNKNYICDSYQINYTHDHYENPWLKYTNVKTEITRVDQKTRSLCVFYEKPLLIIQNSL